MRASTADMAGLAVLDPEIEEAAKVVMNRRGLRLTRHRRTILATIALADHPMSTAEALTNDHRHHLVCLVCGMVGDFIPSRRVEASIRAEARRLLNTIGFDASIHIFDVQGRCNRCR